MDISPQRRAAALTVLRARTINDDGVAADAEEAVSGYLDEDLEDYLAKHFSGGLPENDPVAKLVASRDRLRTTAIKTEAEVCDILAEALGYPLYQPGEPGFSPHRANRITGDHVAQSLAREAAARIAELEATIAAVGT